MRKQWRWVMALGGLATTCALLSLIFAEPQSVVEHIPMLQGKAPFYVGGWGENEQQSFMFDEPYKAVSEQVRKEIGPHKAREVFSDNGNLSYRVDRARYGRQFHVDIKSVGPKRTQVDIIEEFQESLWSQALRWVEQRFKRT